MSRQTELAKNTIILTVGKICTQFVSFFMLPLYTALLTPEEYGVVDLFSTYVMLLVPLFNWQFENGLFRFMLDCRGDFQKQRQLFSTVFFVNIGQSLVYLMVYLFFQRWMESPYKIFLLLNVMLSILQNTLLQFPRGLGNNSAYAFASFLSASTSVVLNVVLIAGFRMGAYGMFLATSIAKVVTMLYLAVSQKVWRYIRVGDFSKDAFKSVLRYSLPLVPNQLSWWVVGVSDRTIISYVLGYAANGIYSVANKFSTVFITFYNIFNMSWTESVALHINDEDRDAYLKEMINSMYRLFSALCLGVIACMPFAYPLLINEKYAEGYNHVPILMLAILFQVVVGLYSAVYVALKKSTEIAKTSFFAAAINLIVDVVLIRFIGLYAASLSTLAAYMVMAVYRYFHVRKFVNISLNPRVLIATLAVGLTTLFTYYCKDMLLSGINLALVAVYAVWINRDFLKSAMKLTSGVLHKKKNH